MDKSPDAFRTISEVAADLDLPQHVLRFWETRFVQIKPLKRGGGRRYYRPDDVELLKGIRHLLYGEGYTIRGVQRILKEQGVRFVMNVWLEGAPQPPKPGAARWDEGRAPEPAAWDEAEGVDDGSADEASDGEGEARAADDEAWAAMAEGGVAEPDLPDPDPAVDRLADEAREARDLARRFAPSSGAAPPVAATRAPSAVVPTTPPRPESMPEPVREPAPPVVLRPRSERPPAPRPAAAETARGGIGHLIDRLRPGGVPASEAVLATPTREPARALSRDEIRRLQSTLFELLECKRLLDQAR